MMNMVISFIHNNNQSINNSVLESEAYVHPFGFFISCCASDFDIVKIKFDSFVKTFPAPLRHQQIE